MIPSHAAAAPKEARNAGTAALLSRFRVAHEFGYRGNSQLERCPGAYFIARHLYGAAVQFGQAFHDC